MKSHALIKSVVTEKSSRGQEKGQYTFMVRLDASKIEVKKEIKEVYGVDVDSVKTSILQSKIRVVGAKRKLVKRAKYKKATVTLKDKKTIDPNKIKE